MMIKHGMWERESKKKNQESIKWSNNIIENTYKWIKDKSGVYTF